MIRKNASYSNLKPVCSVADMIKVLGMSRAQFYNLMSQGVFPPPIYCLRTHRPMYNMELQIRCLEIKESNIGFNGQYVLFYSPRKEKVETETVPATKRKPKADKTLKEFSETLNNMGISVTEEQIAAAISEMYGDEIGSREHGLIIRDLYRFFKNGANG
jgi:hypothetical protein